MMNRSIAPRWLSVLTIAFLMHGIGDAQVVDIPTTPIESAPSTSFLQGPIASQAPATPPQTAQRPIPLAIPDPPQDAATNQLQAPAARPIQPLAPNFPAPNFAAPAANLSSSLPMNLGTSRGSFSAAPTMMGDFFGGGFSAFSGSQTVNFSRYAPGTRISASGGNGSPNSTLAFELGTDIVPDDIFTTGVGTDTVGGSDGADTFSIFEPVPPSDAPTAPGPGFNFDGGTAVYTNNTTSTSAQPGVYSDGDTWFIQYSYTASLGGTPTPGQTFIAVPAPGVASRRIKLSENFSPEVRDRYFANYSFFNDAFGGLGDVSRYVLGAEKIVYENMISLEARIPMAGTYGSTQAIENPNDRNFELGNPVFLAKAVLHRTKNWIWTTGMGVSLPLADDTRVTAGAETIVLIKNESVHLLPFMALMYRPSSKSALQTYVQVDTAANGDPLFANFLGGSLPQLGVFNDSTLLHWDVAYSRSIYHNRCAKKVRQVHLNAELHYTATVQDSDLVSGNGFTYSNLKDDFNILNATTGFHIRLANNLVISPAMSVPLRDGLDEQYDYEAIVQLNYLR